ncbi:hypothetical protein [Saccharopolyspora phatthalungensis]|uniref:Uncharacterized protein n=1 Tax=Saccharopolyspora phatthalungensis TaxID=664693 RepID=A0A840Q662_9PSEU|nr:hypothetical protein [Saccharopolyspora phatthalungensis]MBB5155447.1 hypothetical protein [Saccharopolyspora phatthalungensis]
MSQPSRWLVPVSRVESARFQPFTTNREGYHFDHGKERDANNAVTTVVFRTLDKGDPKRGTKQATAKA